MSISSRKTLNWENVGCLRGKFFYVGTRGQVITLNPYPPVTCKRE